MAPTRADVFSREVDKLIRAQYGEIAQSEVVIHARVTQAMEALRNRLQAIPPDTFSASATLQLRQGLQRSLDQLRDDIGGDVRLMIDASARNAVTKILGPMDAVGFSLPEVQISSNLINVSTRFSADLIANIVGEQLQQINQILTQSALGGVSPAGAIQAIGTNLPGGGPFGSISARAQTILRTESSRVYSIVGEQQFQSVSREIPGMKKMWLHTGSGVLDPRSGHVAYSGTVVKANETFLVGPTLTARKEVMRFPLDPRGSASNVVNCACTMEPVFPEELEEDRLGLTPGEDGTTVPAAAPDLADEIARQVPGNVGAADQISIPDGRSL